LDLRMATSESRYMRAENSDLPDPMGPMMRILRSVLVKSK
jgi:hypothetical protein